jgi:hypothetical protein
MNLNGCEPQVPIQLPGAVESGAASAGCQRTA